MNKTKTTLLCLGLAFITFSCGKEIEDIGLATSSTLQATSTANLSTSDLVPLKSMEGLIPVHENLRSALMSDLVSPSECGPTAFAAVQSKYFNALAVNLVGLLGPQAQDIYDNYMNLGLIAAAYDESAQYFGANGEYTNLMVKRQRELEKFWNMPNQIRVNGQHTATLNNRERLADLYVLANGLTRDQAYVIADQLLAINTFSDQLPESPFFAADGFATTFRNLIVIGDGLVEMISEAGIEQDIVWTGILAHEWAHQIQFKNMNAWYPQGTFASLPESTRYTELEADFLAAYYMTHKRGATYNSKRVAQFYELFFEIGDCGFEEDSHHGTPKQRMAAAELGFKLAADAQKQGHILTVEQAHAYFVANNTGLLAKK
ncbi:hypothetical protein K3G39_01725 [Pontibacter sp. HSC-14F20]|uniref:hypothetical protein n=1 Tax=Pontibacter sp. HSC-14F20 TaxID=2864136 RepID=UPI001C736BFA|nr:hypothetical protein [Pontibacter sp. HSC-14F20]MBX0331950.1 hypothetical protein [Pontibacter sp. HSC-14F20]